MSAIVVSGWTVVSNISISAVVNVISSVGIDGVPVLVATLALVADGVGADEAVGFGVFVAKLDVLSGALLVAGAIDAEDGFGIGVGRVGLAMIMAGIVVDSARKKIK